MNLQKLTIEKFLGINSASMELSAPVNIFVGANNAGKSSICDSIRWLFTGLARSLRKKNEGSLLGHNGGKPRVTGVIDEFELSRTLTAANITEKDLVRRFGDPTLLAAALDAFQLLNLQPKDRAELIRIITSSTEAIVKAAREALVSAGVDAEEATAFSSLAGNDLDEALEACVERRRYLKRKLEEMPVEPPASKVTIGSTEYDLLTADLSKMQGRLQVYQKERDKIISEYGAAMLDDGQEKLKARLEELEKELFTLGPVDKSKRGALIKAMGENKTKEQTLIEQVAAAGARKATITAALAGLEKVKGKCPTCLRPINQDVLDATLAEKISEGDEANAALEEATKALAVHRELMKASDKNLESYKTHESRVADLGVEAACIRERLSDQQGLKAAEAKITDLDTKLDLGRGLIQAKADYDRNTKTWEGRKDIEAQVEVWDKAAKGLGPGGPVRAVASSGFNVDDVRNSLDLLMPDHGLEVDSNWVVSLRGRPESLLSRSERFRIGAAFAASLSASAGVDLLVIDEADLLQGDPKLAFTQWLRIQSERFKRILVFATRSEAPPPSKDGWLAFWKVQDGTVEAVR